MSKTFQVSGMTCEGCVRSVSNAIGHAIPGISVSVDLAAGRVTVDDSADAALIEQAVDDAGFDFGGMA